MKIFDINYINQQNINIIVFLNDVICTNQSPIVTFYFECIVHI